MFDVMYPSNPWEGISTKERPWYSPFLQDVYYKAAVYNRFVSIQFPVVQDYRAPSMTVTTLLPPHPNFDPIGLRQLWMPASYMDTKARTIEFQRYGGKLAYHEYDDMITYFIKDNVGGLRRIIQQGLGHMMTETIDTLARNAFLYGAATGGWGLYGGGSGQSFADIDSSAVLSTELIDDVHLGMAERSVPYASGLQGVAGNIVCITSPGAVRDLRNEATASGNGAAFIDAMRYANATRLINAEVGTYHKVRFVQTPRAILYNCGEITEQLEVTAPIAAGEGSPDPAAEKVDGVWKVGQPGSGVKRYLQFGATADLSEFAVNDIVTIHTNRTNEFGITDGVDFRDGTLHNRRIVSIDNANKRISLDEPIMLDFNTEIDTGVYAYVTKGRHIHTALFIGGLDGVAMGVGMAPSIRAPQPVDDFNSMYRFSWQAYLGYKMWNPQVYEVAFLAGSNRIKGARIAP